MVDCRAEGIHVDAEIGYALAHLLGGDVVGRAPYLVAGIVVLHSGQSEIHYLGGAGGVEENVLGLDVAMYKTLVRSAGKSFRDLLADAHDARGIDVLAVHLHETQQRTAARHLHGDVGLPVHNVIGVYLRDCGMDEPCRRLRLTLEAFKELRILAQRLQHHLERHLPVKHLVAGKENAAHAAMAQLTLHYEAAEFARWIQNRLFVVAHRYSPCRVP